MNAAWHSKHPIPPRATLAQRAAWHLAHAKHCGCRPIPKTVQTYLARREQRGTSTARRVAR
jgi:hypothetical protein